MSPPFITALYASLNALLNVGLAYRVSQVRRRDKVSMGHGESDDLLVAVRTHGNSAEFVPLALLMLLLLELCGTPAIGLHAYGEVLFLSRLAHVVGMRRPAPNAWRVGGNAGTWVLVSLAAAYLLYARVVA